MTTTAGIQHDHTLTVICQGQVGLERSDQRVVLAAIVHRLHRELQLRRNMARQARYLLECLRARLDLPIVLRALRLLLRLRKARRLLGCILDRLELRFAPRLDRLDLRIVLRPKRHELRIVLRLARLYLRRPPGPSPPWTPPWSPRCAYRSPPCSPPSPPRASPCSPGAPQRAPSSAPGDPWMLPP